MLGNGKYIDTNILKGTIQLDMIRDFDWTNQGRPTISDWIVWRKLLNNRMIGSQGLLNKSMVKWIKEVVTSYKSLYQWLG